MNMQRATFWLLCLSLAMGGCGGSGGGAKPGAAGAPGVASDEPGVGALEAVGASIRTEGPERTVVGVAISGPRVT
ncbi:MAG: hypothetical protein KF861_21320, partial [Planctomycetaceae bacterium]|nr:hypothetical protein [Planctomycetaceae bacterium]